MCFVIVGLTTVAFHVGVVMVPSKTAGVAPTEGAESRVHSAANFVDGAAFWALRNGVSTRFVAHAWNKANECPFNSGRHIPCLITDSADPQTTHT